MCLVGMSPQVTQQPIALAQKSGVSSKTYPTYLLFLLLTSLPFPHSFLLPQTCTPHKARGLCFSLWLQPQLHHFLLKYLEQVKASLSAPIP